MTGAESVELLAGMALGTLVVLIGYDAIRRRFFDKGGVEDPKTKLTIGHHFCEHCGGRMIPAVVWAGESRFSRMTGKPTRFAIRLLACSIYWMSQEDHYLTVLRREGYAFTYQYTVVSPGVRHDLEVQKVEDIEDWQSVKNARGTGRIEYR